MRRQLNDLARASIGGGVYQTSTNSRVQILLNPLAPE
jgi:hypothetical protein